MHSRRTVRPLFFALAVLVLAALTVLVPARSARADPSFSVEPGTAEPGESVQLAGTDCVAGGDAQAGLADSEGEPVAYPPDEDGAWSGEYDVPHDLAAGDYTFVAVCQDADGDVAFGYPDRQLTVIGTAPSPTPTPTTATATSSVEPSSSPTPTASDLPSPDPTVSATGEQPQPTLSPSPSVAPTTPGDPVQEEADRVVAALEDGSLAFHPPPSMREGVSEEIVIQVSRPSVPGDPGEALPGKGPVVVVPVEVSTSMTAELSGSDFTVEPPGAQRRILTSSRPAEWRWTVTPKSFGTTSLRLRLAVVLNDDPTTPIIPQVTYDEAIEVHVHPLHTAVRLAKSVQGALTALGLSVAAVVAGTLHLLRRRRRAAPPESAGSAPAEPGTAPIPGQRLRLGRRGQRVAGRSRH